MLLLFQGRSSFLKNFSSFGLHVTELIEADFRLAPPKFPVDRLWPLLSNKREKLIFSFNGPLRIPAGTVSVLPLLPFLLGADS